jgi:hypothetical protein
MTEPLVFGPMEFGAAGIATAIILAVAWYRYGRPMPVRSPANAHTRDKRASDPA